MMTDVTGNKMALNELAHLGEGVLAYVKPISVDDAREIIADLPDMPSDIELYCLFGADGTPLSISDNETTAIASAIEHDLQPVVLH